MNDVIHLLITRILGLQDTVELERLRGAATALVECRNKTLATSNFVHHVVIHLHAPFRLPNRVIAQSDTAEIMVCRIDYNM